jgi:hypothetical protein
MTFELAHVINYIKEQESHMASTKDISSQPAASNVQEDEKLTRSLRSMSSFLTLGAWLGILAGIFMIWSMVAYKLGFSALFSIIISFASAAALFRCSRLLE